MKHERRAPWFLLTGLVIGIVIGILISWVLVPVRYVDADPSLLHPEFRSEYRALVALAYSANADVGRAQARLQLLDDKDPLKQLSTQLKQAAAAQRPDREVYALDDLFVAISRYGIPEPTLAEPTDTPPADPTRVDE